MASFMVEKHNKISISPLKLQVQIDVKLINFSKWKYVFFKILLLLDLAHTHLLRLDMCSSYVQPPSAMLPATDFFVKH